VISWAGEQEIGGPGVVVKGTGFVLGYPDANQVAGNIVALRQPMQGLTCKELLGDLTLEIGAVVAVLGHGFHP
jgi:hypothetical protein